MRKEKIAGRVDHFVPNNREKMAHNHAPVIPGRLNIQLRYRRSVLTTGVKLGIPTDITERLSIGTVRAEDVVDLAPTLPPPQAQYDPPDVEEFHTAERKGA